MKQVLLALSLVLVAAPTFAQERGQVSPSDRVIDYTEADTRMNSAIEEARASLPMFLQEFRAAPPGQRGAFALKLGMAAPGGGREHMWINNLRFEGDDLVGDLANVPEYIPELEIGARIVVASEDISDWSWETTSGLYGAFTTRVMIDDLPPQEAAQYRDMLAPTSLPPHWRA